MSNFKYILLLLLIIPFVIHAKPNKMHRAYKTIRKWLDLETHVAKINITVRLINGRLFFNNHRSEGHKHHHFMKKDAIWRFNLLTLREGVPQHEYEIHRTIQHLQFDVPNSILTSDDSMLFGGQISYGMYLYSFNANLYDVTLPENGGESVFIVDCYKQHLPIIGTKYDAVSGELSIYRKENAFNSLVNRGLIHIYLSISPTSFDNDVISYVQDPSFVIALKYRGSGIYSHVFEKDGLHDEIILGRKFKANFYVILRDDVVDNYSFQRIGAYCHHLEFPAVVYLGSTVNDYYLSDERSSRANLFENTVRRIYTDYIALKDCHVLATHMM